MAVGGAVGSHPSPVYSPRRARSTAVRRGGCFAVRLPARKTTATSATSISTLKAMTRLPMVWMLIAAPGRRVYRSCA